MDDEAYNDAVRNALVAFPQRTTALLLEDRLRFYEQVVFQLTIAGRGIWSDDRLADRDKVEVMKWLNEAQHRILNHSRSLRYGHATWSEDDMAVTLRGYKTVSPIATWLISQAILHSLDHLERLSCDGMDGR